MTCVKKKRSEASRQQGAKDGARERGSEERSIKGVRHPKERGCEAARLQGFKASREIRGREKGERKEGEEGGQRRERRERKIAKANLTET
jgi:hypothetical protein